MNRYNKDIRMQIIKLHLEEGRTVKSLSQEYHICKASIQNWLKAYHEECQENGGYAQWNTFTINLNEKMRISII